MKFDFRPLAPGDLEMLRSWLQRSHIRAVWPSPDSLADLREEFFPSETYGAARPFIANLLGRAVGYVQYYVVAEGVEWWPDRPPPGAVGIDLFLADGDQIGRGLGTAMVEQFVDFLFQNPDVSQIRVDPAPNNVSAIRCYEKVGFRPVQPFTSPDGPALLMVLDRAGGAI